MAKAISAMAFARRSRGRLPYGCRLGLALVGSILALMLWGVPAEAAAGGCTFTGSTWRVDSRTGSQFYLTVLKGASCAEAVAIARPLTGKHSTGADVQLPAPRGWVCQSFDSQLTTVAIGGCVNGAKSFSWAPQVNLPVGGDLGQTPAEPAGPGAATAQDGGGMPTMILLAVALAGLGALSVAVVTRRMRTLDRAARPAARSRARSPSPFTGGRSDKASAQVAPEQETHWTVASVADTIGSRTLRAAEARTAHAPAHEADAKSAAADAKSAGPRAVRDGGREAASDVATSSPERSEPAEVGVRLNKILATAEETAHAVVGSAQAEAERVRSEAEMAAEQRLRDARDRAARITAVAADEIRALDKVSLKTRQVAEETARAMIAAAHAEAERVRNEAELAADQRLRAAQESASRITAEAERLRDEAELDADQRLREAEERAARIAAEATDEIGALDERRAQTRQVAEETARGIVAAAQDEAERVRNEAALAAEQRLQDAREEAARIAAAAADEMHALAKATPEASAAEGDVAGLDDEQLSSVPSVDGKLGLGVEPTELEALPREAAGSSDEERYFEAVINAPATERWLALFQPRLLEFLESRGALTLRDLDKSGWRLPIPAFDPGNEAHTKLVRLARRAETVAAEARESGVNGSEPDRVVREALEASGVVREIDSIVIGLLLQ